LMTTKKRRTRRSRLWIQRAVKKPGALTRSIRAKWGDRAFTSRGTIKTEYLRKATKVKGVMGRRARLALTLRKLPRRY